jgi:hypothetical protein
MYRSISVITTFPPNKWDQYAKTMLETFIQHWPKSIKLKVYHEGAIPEDAPDSNQIEWIDLHETIHLQMDIKLVVTQPKRVHFYGKQFASHINRFVYHTRLSTVRQI